MAESRPFKDHIDDDAVERIATSVRAIDPAFDAPAFTAAALDGLTTLELKDRVRHVARALRAALPDAWPDALQVLVAALPAPLEGTDGLTDAFWWWPVLQVVEDCGAHTPAKTLAALREMTRRFSAEFAIRPVLAAHPELALATLTTWCSDPDPHVRRLVSEGTRPRLPWGSRLTAFQRDPAPTLALLDRLVDDPELYVRRSVANHLGDIAKDHPDLAVRTAQRWVDGGGEQRAWIARHGLRALVKQGDPAALAVLGFRQLDVGVERFELSATALAIGETLTWTAALRSADHAPAHVVVDYAIGFARPTGRTSRKVFKGAVVELEPGRTLEITRRHAFRDVSIRTHHPGAHTVELLVQGRVLATANLTLT
jgi:3-methyladenine DNA glycosylase AlkC